MKSKKDTVNKILDILEVEDDNLLKDFSKSNNIHIKTMNKIRKYFGKDWLDIIEKNPYRVMEIDGFGFRRADIIARKLDFDMQSPYRILAYVELAIELSSNGSTVMNYSDILNKISKDLDIKNSLFIFKTLFESNSDKYLMLDNEFKRTNRMLDCKYMTTTDWYETEKFTYQTLKKLSKIKTPLFNPDKTDKLKKDLKFKLNEKQEFAINNILNKNITVLIGVAGSGKTYTTKTILDVLDMHHYSYILMTPTGISASVLSEKTNRPTQTIHARYYDRDWSDGGIVREIEEDFVIIDEYGMCGVDHMKMIKEMIETRDTPPRFLFIGDIGQLSSISAGDFLNSIIKMIKIGKIDGQVIELTQIMRTATDSYIPYIASMFYGNNKFDTNVLTKELAGVEFIKLNEENIFSQINQLMISNNFSFNDTSIIIPQRVGDIGCTAINKCFQEKNKSEILFQDNYYTFKANDILMHKKNNKNLNIYNGERINLIKKNYDDTYICEKVSTGEYLEYSEDVLKEETMLSHTNTTHKLQGCTSRNVIFVCSNRHSFTLNKNLIYTSLTRASDKLIILYEKDALVNGSYKTLVNKRKTFLGKIAKIKNK